jgi:hypothetical protein
LTNANLQSADLRDACLDEANLAGANLVAAKLSGATFREAKLTGTHLNRSHLYEADFSRADWSEASFSDTAKELGSIQIDDIPLEEARRIIQSPRMDPHLYQELKARLPLLSSRAIRMKIPQDINPITVKTGILRVAAELNPPVTVRRVPGGLLFWRSTDEDVQQAKEVAGRMQMNQRGRRARQGRRPRETETNIRVNPTAQEQPAYRGQEGRRRRI